LNERIKNLQKWLDENVIVPPEPKSIIINQIEVNWEEFTGSFSLTLDSVQMKEKFGFCVEIDGKYRISPPFYHSPLGIPATYAQIELSDDSNSKIEKMLNDFFPKMKPLGLDKASGKMICGNTPIKERVMNVEDVKVKMRETSEKGFQLTTDF
jgi:hypothetical protein